MFLRAKIVSHPSIRRIRSWLALLPSLALIACEEERARKVPIVQPPSVSLTRTSDPDPPASAIEVPSAASVRETEVQRLMNDGPSCSKRIAAALGRPSLPGAPRLAARRGEVLVRARSEPVLFLREPRFDENVTRGIRAHQRSLTEGRFLQDDVARLTSQYRGYKKELRALFLREGYFYTEDPPSAREMSTSLSLGDLFDAKELTLLRGAQTLKLIRNEAGNYEFQTGEEAGSAATLRLFDRVYDGADAPSPTAHLDLRGLVEAESIDQIKPRHLGDELVVAEARFHDEWATVLLSRKGLGLSLDCVSVERDRAEALALAREKSRRRHAVLRRLRAAIFEQVALGLPFDEPKTERGQQDGKLRELFWEAYQKGRNSFRFQGDRYEVFSEAGSALAPQVCVDFITETFERASGMEFAPRGQPPQKKLGMLDFDEILGADRRKEHILRGYARLNPARLGLLDFPEEEWVRYEDVSKFFTFLGEHRDEIEPGDIVVIRGRAAWDRYEELHTHTFFVVESDPISRMPLLLAGNSGRPRLVTWDAEMLRAPRRSIQHRIRPNADWLYDHIVERKPLRGERWVSPASMHQY